MSTATTSTTTDTLRDIKPWEPYTPTEPSFAWTGLVLLAIVSLVAVVGLLWARRRRARDRTESFDRRAAHRLTELADPEGVSDRVFFHEVTHILRSLLESRFRLPARSLSRVELEPLLSALPLPSPTTANLVALLRASEQTLYGGYPADPFQRIRYLQAVQELAAVRDPVETSRAPI